MYANRASNEGASETLKVIGQKISICLGETPSPRLIGMRRMGLWSLKIWEKPFATGQTYHEYRENHDTLSWAIL